MMLAYPLRLVGLCLATFFLVHLALGLAVSAAAPIALRIAARLRADAAARLLLILRLVPPACACFVVAAICIPSYLSLEAEAGAEKVGFAFIAAASLAAIAWAFSIVRSTRAALCSALYGRHSRKAGAATADPGVWVVESSAGVFVMTGILRARIFVSRAVVEALSPVQMRAALLHERAHHVSHDNLKRLCLLLAPGLLPFYRGFAALERGWARFAEWAADDHATAGDASASVILAAALVRVARLSSGACESPLATSLLGGGRDLAARVDRLLESAPAGAPSNGAVTAVAGAAGIVIALSLIAISQPSTLVWVHGLLEHLVR